jgi:uncharacterized protein
MTDLAKKLSDLTDFISQRKTAAVAYSGGVDSTFLAKMVYDTLGENSLAITIDSSLIPRAELIQAKKTAKEIGIRHRVVTIDPLDSAVLTNDEQRCYFCKMAVFSILLTVAQTEGIASLFDGSNLDDLADYRPGMKALAELKIESPLLVCEFTKQEIRLASRNLGLSTWDHPSMACLASRIPIHTPITSQALTQVEMAEDYLRNLGFHQFRVRYHNNLARIEVAATERSRFFKLELMNQVNAALRAIGFKYVSLDLEGYRMGKMNQETNESPLSRE